jgi:citrate synthase
MGHTFLHCDVERQMLSFRHDAHPMGMLIATIASLSTFTPDANPAVQGDPLYLKPKVPPNSTPTQEHLNEETKVQNTRLKFIYRALGKIPTIASNVYRHRQGTSLII